MVRLTFDLQVDDGRLSLKVLTDDGSHLALPLAAVLWLQTEDIEATATVRGWQVSRVSKPTGLGRDALAKRVDVSVGRLPEAEDGLGRGLAGEAGVGPKAAGQFHSSRTYVQRRGRFYHGHKKESGLKGKGNKGNYTGKSKSD